MIDDETFTHPPDGGPLKRWLLGYCVPVLIILYAVVDGLLDGQIASLSRTLGDFTGAAARWLAVAYLSVAAFLHFHYGWGLSETLWPHSQRGKWTSVCLFVPTCAIAFYCQFNLA